MAIEKKFVREQINRLLIKEFLMMETERAGFGGIDIQRTPMGTRVSLIAERPGMIIGRRGSNITRLTADLAANFKAENPQIEVVEAGRNANLNAHIMARKVAEALERGWHFRRAGHSTVRRIMESGAKGCIVILSGKLTGQRHRVEKFIAGHIKYNGDTALQLMDVGYSQCKKKLGTIGCTVKIMHPDARLPDEVVVYAPGEKEAMKQAGRRPEPRPAAEEAPKPEAEEAKPAEGEQPAAETVEEKPERKSRRREPTPVVSEADIKAAEEHAKRRAAEKAAKEGGAAKPAAEAAKSEDKPEAKPAAEPKPEAKPEAKAEAKPEAKAEAKPEAKAEAKPEAKAEAVETVEKVSAPKGTSNAGEETTSRAMEEQESESKKEEKSSDEKKEEKSSESKKEEKSSESKKEEKSSDEKKEESS